MASEAVLQLVMKLKDEASAELKKVEGNLGGVNKAALALGGAAVIGVGALAKGLWDCVDAAKEEEVGIAKLKAAVDASGTSYETVSDSIETYIAAATRKTAFDDGEQREAIARLTMTTGDYNQALDLMGLTMDLARAKDMDLASAAEVVGRVHEGNTGILSRYGIQLREGATAQEALAEMQRMFGGQAEEYGKGFEAAQKKMGIAIGNLKETIGVVLLPVLTTFINKLADLATDMIPRVQQVITDLQPVFEAVWGAIQAAIETAWAIIQPIFDGLVAWFSGPGTGAATTWQATFAGIWGAIQELINTVVPIIRDVIETAFGAVTGFLRDHGDAIQTIIETVWGFISNYIQTYVGVIKGIIEAFTAVLKGDWQGAWDAIKGIVETVWNGIKTHIELVLTLIQTVIGLAWDVIKTAAQSAWDTIKGAIAGKWDDIVSAVRGKVDDVRVAMGNTWNTIHERTVSAWNAIKNDITSPIRDALGVIQGIVSNIIAAWQRLGSFHIPTPHFRGGVRDQQFGPVTVPVPYVDMEWYGKGMPTTVFDKPTMIGVGERGPEAVSVTPLRGGQAGAGAGGGVTITGNTFIVRSDQDIERIARAIYQQMMAQTGQRIALGQGVYVP